MKTWLIYCATSKTSGKSYIGQTYNFDKRRKDHLQNAKYKYKRYAFQHALAKYGAEDFTWQVLEERLTAETANEAEEFYIQYLMTIAPMGYNLTSGGATSSPSHQTRELIREKLRIVGSFVGKKGAAHPNYGRTLDVSHKNRIREANEGENSTSAKISREQVRELYMKIYNGASPDSLVNQYPIKRGAIFNIANKKCWKKATADLPKIDLSERVGGENYRLSTITDQTALNILADYRLIKSGQSSASIRSLARKYNVTDGIVYGIVYNRTWKHLPR